MPSSEKKKKWERLSKILGFTPPLCGLLSTVNNDYALDIIKLDNMVETPNNVSTKDHITEKYGEEAVQLVEDLI